MSRRGAFLTTRRKWYAGAVAALAVGLGVFFWTAVPGSSKAVDFDAEIRPIINESCAACHGGVKRESGLSLLSLETATQPAESGRRAIVPGRPSESELLRRVTHRDPSIRMPADGPALSQEEVERLRRWVRQGAPWPPHWAYVAPQPVSPPPVSDPAWPENGIDRFILARLDREQLSPNPEADCATLLRRVGLDLIGLPPTPEDVERFCSPTSSESYQQWVDELLDSPHFGEHWAAMWLDLARYADSTGYERDPHRSIWKYRDWVIDAFNRDLPFDRFTIEQLAGDLLPEPDLDRLIATAFHRNTMTNTEGGTDAEEFRLAAVIDRVNTTMEVWQGVTMSCVQCHSHPYDPFLKEEFYRLLAFFNNTRDADRPDDRPRMAAFPVENEEEGGRLLAEIEALEAEIEALLETPELVEDRRRWEGVLRDALSMSLNVEELKTRDLPPDVMRVLRAGASDQLVRFLKIVYTPEEKRPLSHQLFVVEFYAEVAPQLEALRKRLEGKRKEAAALDPVWTPVMQELPPGRRRDTHVFVRGNWLVRGERVEPGVPAVLNGFPGKAPADRLGLALWLLDDGNPLTARVAVNRFWARIFGRGIVETLEDFGTQGARPSHPALLDWLALRFRNEHAWSVKSLLREIVLSATYRQSSRVRPDGLEHDPENRLLARAPRLRLSAEQVRDQALAVSGLLSRKMYGPSVMPPQPEGIWNNPHSRARWEESEGEDRHRRAVYTYWKRTNPYPSMVLFDAPSREVCVSDRFTTSTPLQALVTLNDSVFVEAARALAGRMVEEGGESPADRIRRGYELALLRTPEASRLDPLLELYREAVEYYSGHQEDGFRFLEVGRSHASGPGDEAVGRRSRELTQSEIERAALTVVANAVMNLDPFIMKE